MNGVIPLSERSLVSCFHLKLLKGVVKLLHPSSKLDSSLPGPLHVELSGLGVIVHHLHQFIFLEAESDAELVEVAVTSLVGDLRPQVVQDLIVAKVRVSWQDEELDELLLHWDLLGTSLLLIIVFLITIEVWIV